jgi:hypothetical protein
MAKYFVESDLLRLQKRGLKINDPIMDSKLKKAFGIPKKKSYSGKEKRYIEDFLASTGLTIVPELKFSETRKFKFDWAIPSMMLAIEYEGIYSAVSGHTTMKGYSSNCEKYNLATVGGWSILRYTALNYQNIEQDIKALIKTKVSK